LQTALRRITAVTICKHGRLLTLRSRSSPEIMAAIVHRDVSSLLILHTEWNSVTMAIGLLTALRN